MKGDKALMGGLMTGDIDLMGGPTFDRLYHKSTVNVKLQLHDAIYRLRLYYNSLIYILLLSNSHNNAASIQKNRGDKSHHVNVALLILL